MQALFRALPSADACLALLERSFPEAAHDTLLACCRGVLDDLRAAVRERRVTSPEELSLPAISGLLRASAARACAPRLRRVLNGAGVVVHTNLGRSTLAREAQEAVALAARDYCNLEFDLDSGERGSRTALVEGLICELTGAEAALVVNNNAAAVLLMLDTLCKGGEAVLSRGQLVEIGGSFRIPDVMVRSGAILREVGTTNRTHLSDYAEAINEQTRAVLWVHPSNFRVIGFHSAVSPAELAGLAHSRGLPLLEDLGSGSLLDLSPWGLRDEPAVPGVLRSGVDVVTFSGDKVLGGPQAGIIAGKKRFLDAMKKNQLLRALRCGKLTLAALEATLRLYRDPERACRSIPTLRRLTMRCEVLHARAEALLALLAPALGGLAEVRLEDGESRVGGGAFPEQGLPTELVSVRPLEMSAAALRARLLAGDPPLIGRLEHDWFQIDPRTLEDEDFPDVTRVLGEALSPRAASDHTA
ncbi:L-seryl-tRNA(Sec) selenium transferase [uncultured Mailhella sp.]|uniref:L-seryl-tRNA(Sec) selenium transferase n=1 Tax=uncultured Mailhella sp. TaxID=1981031 RepID=UPI002605A48D|nr:L-seryl-tRNA(Sec) selenium transferase [uncultured Mailhella sp.]